MDLSLEEAGLYHRFMTLRITDKRKHQTSYLWLGVAGIKPRLLATSFSIRSRLLSMYYNLMFWKTYSPSPALTSFLHTDVTDEIGRL